METQKSLGKRDLGITAQSQRSSEILMKKRRSRGQSLENQHLRNRERKRGKPVKETKKSIRVVEKKKKKQKTQNGGRSSQQGQMQQKNQVTQGLKLPIGFPCNMVA